MLPEAEVLVRAPAPIVLVHHDTGFVRKVIRFMRMPAGVALAHDRRRCTERGRRHHSRADRGRGKDISQHICSSPWDPFAPRANPRERVRFRAWSKKFV